jgi:carboxypeptidase T
MKRFFAVLTAVIAFTSYLIAGNPLYHTVEIAIPSQERFSILLESGIAMDGAEMLSENQMRLILSESDISRLEEMGFQFEVTRYDMAAFYSSRLSEPLKDGFAEGSMGGNFTFAETVELLDQYSDDFPHIFSEKISIGTSVEGRNIWAIKISDNPELDEDEPELLFTGLHHAREPQSLMTLIYLMDYIAAEYPHNSQIKHLVDYREIWIVPVLNPDGYVYNQNIAPNGGGMHRKNRKSNGCTGTGMGIDLNRNYGYKWGYDNTGSSGNPCDETYRGLSAFSEPETNFLQQFIESRQFINAMNYHSYGNLMLYPFGYSSSATMPVADLEVFQMIAETIESMNGYTAQPSYNLYPTNGGSDDWMYGEKGIYAFTGEIGGYSDGFWPATSRIEPLAAENLQPNLYFISVAGAQLELTRVQINSGVFIAVGDTAELTFTLKNNGLASPKGGAVIRFSSPHSELSFFPDEIDLAYLAPRSNNTFKTKLLVNNQNLIGRQIELNIQAEYEELTLDYNTSVIPGEVQMELSYDAESGLAPWSGHWLIGNTGYNSGHGYDDSPGANYQDSRIRILNSPEITLPDSGLPIITFYAQWDIEAEKDWVQLALSQDGGQSWQNLILPDMVAGSGRGVQALGEYGWAGKSHGWLQQALIFDEALHGETVQFRFTLSSDRSINGPGFIFDDFLVGWIELPDLPAGDINGDGISDSDDYILLLNHVLQIAELDEACFSSADLNQDGRLNILDLLALKRITD